MSYIRKKKLETSLFSKAIKEGLNNLVSFEYETKIEEKPNVIDRFNLLPTEEQLEILALSLKCEICNTQINRIGLLEYYFNEKDNKCNEIQKKKPSCILCYNCKPYSQNIEKLTT